MCGCPVHAMPTHGPWHVDQGGGSLEKSWSGEVGNLGPWGLKDVGCLVRVDEGWVWG